MRASASAAQAALISLLLVLFTPLVQASAGPTSLRSVLRQAPLIKISGSQGSNSTTAPQRNLQVNVPPIPLVSAGRKCTVQLVDHVFANSYGQPAKADYVPPTNADCGSKGGKATDDWDWDDIVLNLTVISEGRQYDRLASIYLSHIEIWRTSTSEPRPTGIYWTSLLDATRYATLFRSPGPLLFDLGNIIDPKVNLTGAFHARLSATFVASKVVESKAKSEREREVFLPISNGRDDAANYFEVPPAAIKDGLVFPDNALEAYAEVYASGNGMEEFWYTNALDNVAKGFDPDLGIIGKGPYREVQLLVDGKIAGAFTPFPVIYTGGIINLIWSPVAAYGAYIQPTYTISLTPLLPLLTDSRPHNLTLVVVGQGTSPARSINANWFVSGNVRVRTSPGNGRTTGKVIKYEVTGGEPKNMIVNGTVVKQDVDVKRKIRIESVIESDDGRGGRKREEVRWESEWTFANRQTYAAKGANTTLRQTIVGKSAAIHCDLNDKISLPSVRFLDHARFPLTVDTTYVPASNTSNTTITGTISSTYSRSLGLPFVDSENSLLPSTSHVTTTQNGQGTIKLNKIGRVYDGSATLRQTYVYVDTERNTYERRLSVEGGEVKEDRESGSLGKDPATSGGSGKNGRSQAEETKSEGMKKVSKQVVMAEQ